MEGKITEQKWFVYALVPLCALMWGMSYLGTSVTLTLSLIHIFSALKKTGWETLLAELEEILEA